MTGSNRLTLVIYTLGLVACGSNSVTDAGHDAATTPQDSGATGTDAGNPADVGAGADVASDAGPSVAYGTCGMTVATCLCGCMPDDSVCRAPCIEASMVCTQCVLTSQMTCCPTEFGAEQSCFASVLTPVDGGAPTCARTDEACLNAHCMTAETALDRCLTVQYGADGGTPSTTCIDALTGCLGTATCPGM